ncbi:MAG: hypothetical protein ABIK44_07675 [candidate division WOR-3 bacterium]
MQALPNHLRQELAAGREQPLLFIKIVDDSGSTSGATAVAAVVYHDKTVQDSPPVGVIHLNSTSCVSPACAIGKKRQSRTGELQPIDLQEGWGIIQPNAQANHAL